jgi:Zn ribbon nucleic-acid-binding protein
MDFAITCPACGEEDTLQRKFDAWACYGIRGVDADGRLVLSDDFDTQIFDDNHIECGDCGKEFTEGEIVDHLQRTSNNPATQSE